MCGTWKQEKWLASTRNEVPGYVGNYSLHAERYNEQGQRALQIKTSADNFYNIYSYDGKDYSFFGSQAPSTHELNKRGFTLTEKPEPVVEEDAVAVGLKAALSGNNIDIDINTEVDGRTILDWAKQGIANESGEHVHPVVDSIDIHAPEGLAYVLSLTPAELFIVTLLEGLELPEELSLV